jgi:hypothetical protein
VSFKRLLTLVIASDTDFYESPNELLRKFPALQADQIKRTTLAIIKMIPDDVYSEIVTHAQ